VLYTFNHVTGDYDLSAVYDDRRTLDGVYSFRNWHEPSFSDNEWAAYLALQDVENNLEIKALGKIADAKVNVAVAYAEAHKTSDLIYSTARRIDRAYRAFRRGDLKGVARNLNITPKKLHNSWLEYKYGWMPLLMDVKGAAEFFAQQHVVRPPRFKVTCKTVLHRDYFRTFKYAAWGGAADDATGTEHDTRDFVATLCAWCELSSPHLSELQQLGLTNPALVAWELVPFSFVFDWFISVGDWLTGLTALQGVTVLRAFYSVVSVDTFAMGIPATIRADASYKYESAAQTYELQKRLYTRVPFVFEPGSLHPPVKDSYDFPKLVTSLALLKANYRGNARL
jgi:hypothetical protein